MTKLLAVAALLALSGCVHVAPLDSSICLSDEFTAEQSAAIADGLTRWNADSHGQTQLELYRGWCDVTIAPDSSLGKGTVATTYPDNARIGVNPAWKLTPIELTETVMHELGHAMGVNEHTEGTLMHARGFEGAVVDCHTQRELGLQCR
jgi:hypothetical protein